MTNKTSNEIRSINDLVTILHNLQEPEQGKTRFFVVKQMKHGIYYPAFIAKINLL